MEQKQTENRGIRFLFGAASVVVIIAGLKMASDLILPILTGFFLAMVSLPLLNRLQRWKVSTPLAVIATVFVEVGVIAGIVTLVGGSFAGFRESAPVYKARLDILFQQLLTWLDGMGIELSRELVADLFDPGMAFDMVGVALKGITGVLSQVLLVLLLVVFTLFEATGVPDKLQAAFGGVAGSERYDRIRTEVQRYLSIKTLISLFTGAVVAVGLALLGVDYAVLWGLLAFMLNYIPNLGSILAAIPPVLLALVQFGPGRALAVALLFVAINVGLGNFVEPYFMGRRLGLSTLVVFISLLFWGWMWGPVGMLLSVPLTMIVKIMLENTRDLKWVAILLDAKPPKASPNTSGNGPK